MAEINLKIFLVSLRDCATIFCLELSLTLFLKGFLSYVKSAISIQSNVIACDGGLQAIVSVSSSDFFRGGIAATMSGAILLTKYSFRIHFSLSTLSGIAVYALPRELNLEFAFLIVC